MWTLGAHCLTRILFWTNEEKMKRVIGHLSSPAIPFGFHGGFCRTQIVFSGGLLELKRFSWSVVFGTECFNLVLVWRTLSISSLLPTSWMWPFILYIYICIYVHDFFSPSFHFMKRSKSQRFLETIPSLSSLKTAWLVPMLRRFLCSSYHLLRDH